MTISSASFDWVREISPELIALDAIPLTGASPSFPWDQLASKLSQSFEREIKLKPGQIEWRTKNRLYEGLGDSPFPLTLSIPSIRGSLCWVMPEQDMTLLESLLLTKETHPLNFQDKELSESFYHFLALEFLYGLTLTEFDQAIIPILSVRSVLPAEDSLCFDIALHVQQQILWGRLIISPEFRRSWVEYFTTKEAASNTLTKEIARKVDVIVHLEVGKTDLTFKEWSTISLGDFILLDRHSLDQDFNGRIMLTINGKPVFRAKLKDGHVKILENPLYHEADTLLYQEAETPMAKNLTKTTKTYPILTI